MKQILRTGLFLLLFGMILLAAEPKSAFKGFVRDESGAALMGANVLIKELYIGAATTVDGSFFSPAQGKSSGHVYQHRYWCCIFH